MDMMQDQSRDSIAMLSPFRRMGTPADVADVVVFLASDAARWVTGQTWARGWPSTSPSVRADSTRSRSPSARRTCESELVQP